MYTIDITLNGCDLLSPTSINDFKINVFQFSVFQHTFFLMGKDAIGVCICQWARDDGICFHHSQEQTPTCTAATISEFMHFAVATNTNRKQLKTKRYWKHLTKTLFLISPRLRGVPDGECTTSGQHHRISAGNCSLYWRHSNVPMAKRWVGRNIWKYVLCRPPVWTVAAWNHGAFTTPQHRIFWQDAPSCAEKHAYLQRRTRQVIFDPQCLQVRAIHGPYVRVVAGRHETKRIVFEQTRKKK